MKSFLIASMLVIAGIGILVAHSGLGSAAQDLPVVLCLGDSSLYTTASLADGFPFQLQRLTKQKANVIQGGVIGNDILGTIGEYHLKYQQLNPRIVVLRIGWNDHMRVDWAHGAFAPRLRQFATELRAKGASVVILDWETPSLGQFTDRQKIESSHLGVSFTTILSRNEELQRILMRVANETGAEFVKTGLTQDDFDATDPVHPNARGAEKIAKALIDSRTFRHLTN